MQQFPRAFVLRDEIYQLRNYSRDNPRVLMPLDSSKLDLSRPADHRTDHDFAVTFAKNQSKGRVYYSTLSHPPENWDNPALQKMFVEAIRWVTGQVNADVTPCLAPSSSPAS